MLRSALLTLALLVAQVAQAITYNSVGAAAANADEINAALANGERVTLGGGIVYVDDELVQANVLGGGICGAGMAYWNGENGGGYGGQTTAIVWTQPVAAMIRVKGSGLHVRDVALIGARMVTYPTLTTARSTNGLLLEGRDPTSSGKVFASNVLIGLCETAIRFAATPSELHADESTFVRVWTMGCDTFVRSDNQQAVSHHFYSCAVGGRLAGVNEEMTVFDFFRGGNLYSAGLIINHPNVLLLRTAHWSPNTNRFDIVGFRYDTPTATPKSIRLFEWDNPYGTSPASYTLFDVRISGHIAEADTATTIGEMVQLDELPGDKIWFDVTNMPLGTPSGYKRSVSGPLTRFRKL